MTAPQILRWMLTADAAQSNTPLLEPAAEAGSEHQLSANIATFVTLFTQELCERTKMRCDRTDGAFLWHTRQNHLLVDAVSHDWAPFPEKSGRRGSQDYIESNPLVCRTLKGFGTWLAYSGAQEIVSQSVKRRRRPYLRHYTRHLHRTNQCHAIPRGAVRSVKEHLVFHLTPGKTLKQRRAVISQRHAPRLTTLTISNQQRLRMSIIVPCSQSHQLTGTASCVESGGN